jgi:hypothetical protein
MKSENVRRLGFVLRQIILVVFSLLIALVLHPLVFLALWIVLVLFSLIGLDMGDGYLWFGYIAVIIASLPFAIVWWRDNYRFRALIAIWFFILGPILVIALFLLLLFLSQMGILKM